MTKIVVLLFVLVATAVGIWCLNDPAEAVAAPALRSSHIQIAVLVDNSQSCVNHGIPRCTDRDLKSLCDAMIAQGGGVEIAVGAIDSSNGSPLVRLNLEAAPPDPATVKNLFARQAAKAKYAEWQAESAERVRNFLVATRPLIHTPIRSGATNIAAGLRRAITYFGESNAGQKILLIVSDLEHDSDRSVPPVLPLSITPVIVSGPLRPPLARGRFFEGPSAAIRYIASLTGKANVTKEEN